MAKSKVTTPAHVESPERARDRENADQPGLHETSNESQRSPFESNYPSGSRASSGTPESEDTGPERSTTDLKRADTYGPAPGRDEILPPDADPAAQGHPADGNDVPGSVATGPDNDAMMRHFASPAEYEAWRRRAAQDVKR